MFQLNKTIVSEEILEKEFVCNLSACLGACCVDGDAGAPLDEEETKILAEIYPKIKAYLRPEGIQAIEAQGTHIVSEFGELETPLIEGKDCAYVIFDGKTALCGIEQAYNEGIVTWKKPVSCHLYPIRVKEYSDFSAVNYHKWHICSDACSAKKFRHRSVGDKYLRPKCKASREFIDRNGPHSFKKKIRIAPT